MGACARIARYLGCIITDSCSSATLIARSRQKPQPTRGRARWRSHHQTLMLRPSWLTCRCRRSSGETPEETIEHVCRAHRTFPQMRDQILQSEKQLVPLNAWFNSSPFLARKMNIIPVAKHVIGLQSTTGGLSMSDPRMMNAKRINVQEYVIYQ